MSLPKRIAVVAPNWLGDAVMSLDAIGALAGARVSVLVSPYVARVYAGIEGVDELIVDRPSGRIRRMLSRARWLDATDPDVALVLPPSFSSALTTLLGGVTRRVGYRGDVRDALLSDALPSEGLRDEHLSTSYRRLASRALELAGVEAGNGSVVPSLHVDDRDRDEAAAVLMSAGVPEGRYAVVVPGAAYGPAKTWPEDRFDALCAGLSGDLPVVLTGGPGDKVLCLRIASARERVFSVAGESSLGGFFAILEGAAVVIANDSGAPHASASLGRPTITLFGSTSPVWTAPRGERVDVIRHPVSCSPCFRRTCPTRLECFNGITPDAVLARARECLSGAGG
jgi:heptosyltransferase-2